MSSHTARTIVLASVAACPPFCANTFSAAHGVEALSQRDGQEKGLPSPTIPVVTR